MRRSSSSPPGEARPAHGSGETAPSPTGWGDPAGFARDEELPLPAARAEAIRLARHVLDLDEQLKSNDAWLDDPAKAGVNPIPASPGNTVRHQPNRGGGRALNSALHMAALTTGTHDVQTRDYVQKRRAEGRTVKGIRRCIKRHPARRVFRILKASVKNKQLQSAA